MVDGRRTFSPYEVGDFDALFVFMPCRRFVFLIPSSVLAIQGVLKAAFQPGKTAVPCYTSDRKFSHVDRDNWSQKYCYDALDSEFVTKITKALADIADLL